MSETVLYEVVGRVATITLHRPERLNAFDMEMRRAFPARLAEAERNEDVSVVVITGSGRAFSAGADRDALAGVDGDMIRYLSRGPEGIGMDRVQRVGKPTIAAVNGPCAGLGFTVALLCDVRIAAEDARFTTAFSRLGLPAEDGVAWALPRLVGQGRAADLLFSSRVIDGVEAERIGLVQHVHPADRLGEEVAAYAAELAGRSEHSLRTMKAQLWAEGGGTFEASYEAASELTARCVDRPQFQQLLADRPRA